MIEPRKPELLATTYRKGMLARLGHDLRLSLGSFEIVLEASRLRGRFNLGSLRVVGALERGRVDPSVPRANDRAEIERVARQLLRFEEHPQALLEGALTALPSDRVRFEGELCLAGANAPLRCEASLQPDVITCSLELSPSRWGIKPYRALGGALQLDDRLTIAISLPADVPGFDRNQWKNARASWSREPQPG